MGKFIKGIIFLILFFIFIIVIGVGIIVFYTYDDEPISYDVNGSYSTVEEIVSRDLYNSLNTVKDSNYLDNELVLEFSIDDLNNYLVEIFRDNINEEYLIDEDYLVQESGFSLDSILFVEENDALALKIRFSAYQFYASTITYCAEVSIDSNKSLQVSLGDLVLGNHIKVSKKLINTILSKFSDSLDSFSNFDLESMTLSFDLEGIISSFVNDSLFEQLITSCEWKINFDSSIIYLIIDTTKVFDGGKNISNVDYSNIYDNLKTKINSMTITSSIDFIISEEEFSAILFTKLDDTLMKLEKTIGNDDYPIVVSTDGFEYDLKTDSLYTNLLINNVKTTIKLLLYTRVNDDNITIMLNNGYIGETNIVNLDEIFEGVIVDATSLISDEDIIINSITIDKNNEQIIMNISNKL